METVLIKGLQLIVALGLLVVLHEGGHFLAAKMFGIRVEKFYLFFDWKFSLFSTKMDWWRKLRGKGPAKKKEDGTYEYEGTEYGIGWIPLGGYVAISGMVDESSFNEEGSNKSFWKQLPQLMKNIVLKNSDIKGESWEFRTHPAWQRLIVMLGGIFMNFLTAFIIYAMVLFAWGESYIKSEDMNFGMKFSEQAKADGFADGDIIVEVDGEAVETWNTGVLQDISNAKSVTVLRDGEKVIIALPGKMNLLDMLEQGQQYAAARIPFDIDSILPNSPAADAGLKKGDVITSANGIDVTDFNDFQKVLFDLKSGIVNENDLAETMKARRLALVINGTDSVTATLTEDFTLGFVNKMPYSDKVTVKEYGFAESIPAGIKYGWDTMCSYTDQMKYVFTKKGASQLGGFISIGNVFPNVWDWHRFWLLTAFLSVILGVMNLLPIPALDGGHALCATFELITRRRLNDNFLLVIQYFGMWLLIIIMILAQANDIFRLLGI